jgi:maltose alpha-D-glucosyltransferase / alpha-amylase
MPIRTPPHAGLDPDPAWYRNAVIYELHVRAFQDSDASGTGDFKGLTTKLDYLRDLGVSALWLLPFYPSPLKDDGYDIADYCDVHPRYGTLPDFKLFLRQAHRRGLRVITELVLNHTSDQHPWFQRSRRAKPGSRWRDFYVWSDNPEKYKGTRVIFKDTETSNWSWDPVANSYFWHRFYSHQPDLNYDHPPVHREMFRAIDFWLKLGVDGLRLDAVPYLYEREGTSCENLPETHAFLKAIRRHVDQKYQDRMLLAEANQWPEDAITYFGNGDECHMAFHFPLMPRLFMALRMEDRVPIVDILQQTPPLPDNAQWALFLRNHDELTLEMVTDEERDYMYRMYAHTHLARLNLGIRRRLAPLLGNDRRRIELLNALLFSLPGSPVIYYGDEIGMGENIYLGDRNGVRTPMQWSADRNAGFSRANPQSLYLPINFDPENHYEAVNVDVQQRNPHSLLWWTKRLVALRKRWVSLGLGSLEFLHPENRKILAFIRRHENQHLLVVANLSRFVQPVELDLAPWQGLVPIELFGRTEFPTIADRPYFLTLSPHAFFWFSLEPKAPGTADVTTSAPPAMAPIHLQQDWEDLFADPHRTKLENAVQQYLPGRRWFGGKAKTIKAVHLHDLIPVPLQRQRAVLLMVQVDYLQSEPDFYLLPLACATGPQAESILQESPGLILLHLTLTRNQTSGVVFDATVDREFCRALLDIIARRRVLKGRHGELDPSYTPVLRQLREAGQLDLEPVPARAEQSNSSIVFGDRLILKFLRRLEPGVNPELDIGRHLAAHHFPHTPPMAGALEYRTANDEVMSLATLGSFMPGCKDAWSHTLDTLGRFYERVQTLPPEHRHAPPAIHPILSQAESEIPLEPLNVLGTYAESARLLGQRTAELHLALAQDTEHPDFAPEPFTPHYQRGLYQSMRNLTRQNLHLLNRRLRHLPEKIAAEAQPILAREADILARFRSIHEKRLTATRIRVHGDYHLGQVLHTGKDFLIIDFEGEPARSLGERRLKRSPLSDVAGMIRSFHYAAHAALLEQTERGTLPAETAGPAATWAQYWFHWVSVIFLRAYTRSAGNASFLPQNPDERRIISEVYLLEKAIYELGYELNNRPQWLPIPLEGIRQLLN